MSTMITSVITRRRHGKACFSYVKNGRKISSARILERIKKLTIPPAWNDVEIASDQDEYVQATGVDSAGRKQAIYHETYRQSQEKAKFARILQFGERLPAMRRQVEADLARRNWHPDKVHALIVQLMDQAYFRIGNDQYAREHQTYGITTIRSKHLTLKTDSVVFDFVGKSGQKHHKKISDRRIARLIRQLDDMPGYGLFSYIDHTGERQQAQSADVNEYIKRHMGEAFTAKDFRTWGGTLLASSQLIMLERANDESNRKKQVNACIKSVARKLGNTPAVARSSYVDPRIISAYMDDASLSAVRETMKKMKPRKYLSSEEQVLLEVLR